MKFKINWKIVAVILIVATILMSFLIVMAYTTMLYHVKSPAPPIPAASQTHSSKHLFVDALYLLKTGETNYSVNVTATLYITNTWNDTESGNIKIIVYVVDKNRGIATNKSNIIVGNIQEDATKEVEIPITLVNSTSRVDFLIFENEKLVSKGSTTVSITPVQVYKLTLQDETKGIPAGRWIVSQKEIVGFVDIIRN